MEDMYKNVHYPDRWVILRIKSRLSGEAIHKLLSGFSGSYLTGQSWTLNRGVERVELSEDGKCFIINPHTSSVYHIFPDSYGLNLASAGALSTFEKSDKYEITVLSDSEADNFLKKLSE